MTLTAAIDIALPCVNWKRACPDLERLVRDTALVALVEGIAAIGVTSLAQVELGITLTDDAHQRELNRRYREQDVSTNVLAFHAWEPRTLAPVGAPLPPVRYPTRTPPTVTVLSSNAAINFSLLPSIWPRSE